MQYADLLLLTERPTHIVLADLGSDGARHYLHPAVSVPPHPGRGVQDVVVIAQLAQELLRRRPRSAATIRRVYRRRLMQLVPVTFADMTPRAQCAQLLRTTTVLRAVLEEL